MPRDFHAPTNPDALELGHVIQKSLQRDKPPWATQQARMHAN